MNHIRTRFLAALVIGLGMGLSAWFGLQKAQAQDSGPSPQAPLGSPVGGAFTYQGRLKDGATPATGDHNFQFSLWDSSAGGLQIGATISQTLNLSEGIFTTELDFGGSAFSGEARWLEIAVKKPADGSYTTLNPRQTLSAVPYAASLRPGAQVNGNLAGAALSASNTSAFATGIYASGSTGVYASGSTGIYSFGSSTALYAYGANTGIFSTASNLAIYGEGSTGVQGQGGLTGVYGAGGPTGVAGRGFSTGVYGQNTATAGAAYAGYFDASGNPNSTGVYASGGQMGVYGLGSNPSGYGVQGGNAATSGANYGVYGWVTSTDPGAAGVLAAGGPTGVFAVGNTYGVYALNGASGGTAVYGWQNSATGANYGVFGRSDSTDAAAAGVRGQGTTGVYGSGVAQGLSGYSASGTGVYGDGGPTGVYGTGSSQGVYGEGTTGVYGNGSGYGLYGTSFVTGVFGTGNNAGVYGSGNLLGVVGTSTNWTGVAGWGGSQGVYGNGSLTGVYGTGSSQGLYGEGSTGVYGTGSNTGLYGLGGSTGAYGSGSTYGLYGTSTLTGVVGDGTNTGTGVYGYGAYGVYGSGGAYGLYGYATNTGVYGDALLTGVYGTGSNQGLYGLGGSTGAYGSGSTYGLYGNSASTGVFGFGSTGIYGFATDTGVYGDGSFTGVYGTGSTYGLYGNSALTGVYASGNGTGIYATSNTSTGVASFFRASKNATDTSLNGHVSVIYNADSAGADGADVLALIVGDSTPATDNNFITFLNGNTSAVGAIEGNGAGGVTYKSGSADFAEYLPLQPGTQRPAAADVVGLRTGSLSLATNEAQAALVVSTAPIVKGNAPEGDKTWEEAHVLAALLGQAPVKVRGPVDVGDFILPSGKNDGFGVALPASKLPAAQAHLVVGRALESKRGPGEGQVRILVGAPGASPLAELLAQAQSDNARRDERLAKAEQELADTQARLARLEKLALQPNSPLGGLDLSGIALGGLGLLGGLALALYRRK